MTMRKYKIEFYSNNISYFDEDVHVETKEDAIIHAASVLVDHEERMDIADSYIIREYLEKDESTILKPLFEGKRLT